MYPYTQILAQQYLSRLLQRLLQLDFFTVKARNVHAIALRKGPTINMLL